MNERIPRSLQEYLDQLREALRDADPALRQDALYDAEEYLRAELNGKQDRPESEVIAGIVRTYGAPEEVAEVYRQTEETVNRALRTPPLKERRGVLGHFFGVYSDPRAYASLFYMLLSIATGTFYFTWAVTGLSLSAGLMILIIGIPFFLLFVGSTRLFSLLEGRIVETFLGVRMPRRPVFPARDRGIVERIVEMLKDVRTWTTILYMLLMLPLGVFYFTAATVVLATSLGFMAAPFVYQFDSVHLLYWNGESHVTEFWQAALLAGAGFLLLTIGLHLFRALGYFQGQVARGLLVKPGQNA